MASVSTKTRALTAVVVLSNVLGNFALGWGMKHQSFTPGSVALIAPLFTPWVAVGVTLLVVWLLSRMTLLSIADLSYVLPVTSIGYVLTAVVGKLFFNEQITLLRWSGTLLIMGGIALVGMTSPRTVAPAAGER